MDAGHEGFVVCIAVGDKKDEFGGEYVCGVGAPAGQVVGVVVAPIVVVADVAVVDAFRVPYLLAEMGGQFRDAGGLKAFGDGGSPEICPDISVGGAGPLPVQRAVG